MKNSKTPLTEIRAARSSLTPQLALGFLACSLQLAAAGSVIEITTPPRYSIPETAEHATVTLSRTGDTETQVSVTASTTDITATSGVDYTPVSTVVTFSPGQTEASVTIPVHNDGLVEGAETFNLSLSSPSETATLGTHTSLRVLIHDNDPGPAFTASTIRTVEDIGAIVTRSLPPPVSTCPPITTQASTPTGAGTCSLSITSPCSRKACRSWMTSPTISAEPSNSPNPQATPGSCPTRIQ